MLIFEGNAIHLNFKTISMLQENMVCILWNPIALTHFIQVLFLFDQFDLFQMPPNLSAVLQPSHVNMYGELLREVFIRKSTLKSSKRATLGNLNL